jgi:ankyrin repeat protein
MRPQDQKFIDAIVNDNVELAFEAIIEGADINVKNENGEPALSLAVAGRKINSINFLLGQNVNVNAINGLNETALILAVKEGYTEAVRAILNIETVDLHIQSYLYGTALTTAIYFDKTEIIDLLLSKEKVIDNNKHPLALVCAVEKDNEALLIKLLKQGADINSSGKTGYIKPPYWVKDLEDASPFTPMGPPVFDVPVVVAMQGNHLASLNLLVSRGADLTKKGSSNLSAEDLLKSNSISAEAKQIVNGKTTSSTSTTSWDPNFFAVHPSAPSTVPDPDSLLTEKALKVFFGLFSEAWEPLENFKKEDQKLIVNILNDHTLTSTQASQLVRQIEIDNGLSNSELSSSFNILFCGLFPDKWEAMNDKMTVQNFFDTPIKLSSSINTDKEERQRLLAELEKKASACLKSLINHFNENLQTNGDKPELNSDQLERKQALMKRISNPSAEEVSNQPAIDDDTNQTQKKSFVDEYLELMAQDSAEHQKAMAVKKVLSVITNIAVQGIIAHETFLKSPSTETSQKWDELNVTDANWKRIYEIVKTPQIYKGKIRNENLMLGVVKAILYKQSKNCKWVDLPRWCPPRSTVSYYKNQWAVTGQLQQVLAAAAIPIKPSTNATTTTKSGFPAPTGATGPQGPILNY